MYTDISDVARIAPFYMIIYGIVYQIFYDVYRR